MYILRKPDVAKKLWICKFGDNTFIEICSMIGTIFTYLSYLLIQENFNTAPPLFQWCGSGSVFFHIRIWLSRPEELSWAATRPQLRNYIQSSLPSEKIRETTLQTNGPLAVLFTCHDDVEDAGLPLGAHLVGGLAHEGPVVHGSEGGIAGAGPTSSLVDNK